MPADITKYGISGLKGLKGVNTNVDPEYQEALQYRNRTLRGSSGPTLRDTFSTFSYDEGSPMSSWGTSGYDNEIMNVPLTSEQVQDTRYENQTWYDTFANGVGKMLGTAATTFASSLLGLPYGLVRTGAAAVSGEDNPWANLWDNEITQGLSEVEDWMEKNMTNYKSTEQQNAPWYSLTNLGSMNFWADDVIKNAGFTLGAAASMAVGSGALGLLSKSMGIVNKASTGTKIANGFLSALFSATGEGMIEAKNGVDERNKLEMQRLNDMLAPERQALEMELNEIQQDYAITGDYEAYKRRLDDYTLRKDYLDQKEAAGMEEIERSGKDMGNKILMGNQALLTAGNLIQFGKLMTKSFNNARHAAEVSSKSARPSMWRDGFTATRNSADDITKGYSMSSKNLGRLRAGTKGLLTEGSEEMNQQWIQSGAGAAYNERDVNDYWKAKLDQKAYRDTTEGLYTLGSALSQGFNESWGDVNQWEQFVIGGLTGMAGSYSPTKLFNQDKTKSRWDPRRYGSWEGGAYNEIRDFNDQYNQYAENIDDLNKILDQENFGARVQNLIAHSFLEKRKEQAALENDMKTWKDEDDKQTVHDIQAFYRAGKIDDLRTLYNEMSQDMSDDDIESIVKRTTKVTTAEEDRNNYYAALDEEIEKKQQNVDDLYNQLESVQADYGSGNIAEDEAQSKTRDLTSKISNAEAEVGRLTEERNKKDTSEGYNGSAKYEGPYVDITGHQIKTNNEIREEVKGNAEKLQRRLDQYLEGIQEVNDRTNGQLSKDQEDNLAYLHFISRRKGERFNDIMKDIRKQIPNTFLIKTNQTPEQLTQQYASSDLAFNKNENTPEGYVEVNTSMMNDNNFGAFFADTVLWGDNIHPAYTKEDLIEELEAREEDKKYSKEEQDKRREERAKKQNEKAEKMNRDAKMARDEQQKRNLDLIKKAIVDNALYKEGKSLVQALKEDKFGKLLDAIDQALTLRNEEAEYENTLDEYMRNPQKVNQDKKKAEKTNTEKAKKEAEDKATTADMMDMDDDDLAVAVLGGRKGKNKNGKKAQKAMGLKNSRSKAEKSLDEAVASGKITREAADDALKLLDNQIGKMLQEDDEAEFDNLKDVASKVFDTSTEAMDDAEALWDDELRDAINNGAVEWEEVEDDFQARLDSAKDAIRLISDPVEKELEEYDQSIDMGKQFKDLETEEQKGTKELDEKISQAADESKAAENHDSTSNRNGSEKSDALKAVKPRRTAKTRTSNKKKAQPEPEELEEPEVKLSTAGDDAALEEDKAGGEKGNTGTQGNKVWGLWHTGVSEISQYGNKPWTADPSDPNAELQQKRYDAIRKKLMDGAYTARKLGKVTPGMKIGFKIFQDVNDEAGDFVVFITDEKGNIIGDLPSEDARFNREKFPISMDDLYKALHEEWDDTTDEEKKAGMQSQYTTVVDEVLVGKVRYQEDRQTVEQLTSGSDTKVKPLFAIKRPVDRKTGKDASSGAVELRMDTGTDSQGRPLVSGVHMPLTGKAGQPYVLIQTPGVYTDSPIKYLAVPIKTMTVGEANTNNTIYSKVLKTILDNIKQGRISDFDARRILEALLSVHSVHVNLDEGSNTKKELGIRIRSFNRENGITKGVPYTIYEGKREDMDVNAIMEALTNVQINVSSQLINGKGKEGIVKYLTLNGEPVSYNDMLAEVAHTNAAEPQAVNDWFTIKPLQQKGDDLQMVENSVKMESWADVEVDDPDVTSSTGETWTVKISEGYTVYDAEGRQITTKTHGKNKAQEAAILAAEKFGEVNSKPSNRPYAVLINGKSYIFNPVNRTFKTYAQAEKDPKYVYEKVKDGKKLTEQEKYTIMKDALERQMLELDELWEERRRQQETSTPQQIGQDIANVSPEVEEQLLLVFERIPELNKIGSIREYAAYLADIFPNSVDKSIYWHGTNEDMSEGFKSAKKGRGSGAPETQLRNDFYLAKQAWSVLQYVNGVNRNSIDKNGFAHWNKLWWELKEIMSNGRRENNNWKDMVIGEETVRQGIPNKKGVFNRDKGGENGKWLSERKADYGYENKSDKEFFEDILGIQWGKDTFNTWTKRNAEVFKALEKTQKGIYPAIINTQNPIREKGQNTYYEEQRGLFTQAEREGNDAILGENTDNEFGSDVAVVLNASENNVHFLGTKEDIEGFKKWLEENRASKVIDENGEPLVVYHHTDNPNLTEFSTDHTEEVRAAIAKMEEESKHYKLVKWDDKQKKYVEDREGNYYRDDRDGSIHARVSNVNDADIEVIAANKEAKFGIVNPQLKKASTGAGNVVDRFVREFFRNGDLFEGLDLNTTEGSNTAIERMKDIAGDSSFQNISTDDMLRLGMALHEFKQSLGADWKINSSGIVASGIVSFDGNTMVKVAGTIDLLIYNEKEGKYGIIDMKTHLAPLFRKNGDLRTDAKTLAKIAHWRAQQTLYKQFLEMKYKEDGVKSVGLRIMPFKVDYSTKFAETDYQVGDDGVLRDKGIVVDINPKYDGRLVRLAPKENTKYDVGQLSESIKRLLPRKKASIIKQPEDPEVEVKGKLIDIRDSVPEGRSLKEFISAKYKDNDDVKKLMDILEANRGEANPVMMTQASQKLLLAAINQIALDKAIQEAKAAAEKLKVDIPEQEEMDLDTFIEELEASGSYSDDVIEFIQELPEDLQKKVMNSNLATIISAMIDQDASDEDIQQAIRNYDLNARHKKAVKEYTLIDLPKELRWMRENLPQLSSERRLHIIKGLIRCSDGTESFGQVNASMILIGTQAAEGTVYHEAFHAVVQFLLTDDEINSLFEAAKKRWGDLSAAALEERMADEFENYMKGLDPEDNRIKRFFKELWRAIRAWLGNKSYMENLYRNINSGVYAARDVRDDRNNALSRIRSEQRDITKDYSFLTEDEKERVKEAGVSKETWNQLTKKQQEYMLHCVV